MHKAVTPIKIWIYAIAVSTLLVLVFSAYTLNIFKHPNRVSNAYRMSLKETLQHFHAQDSSRTTVLFFGSSPSFFAIPNSKQLENDIELNTGLKLNLLKVNILWLNMDKLLNSEFLDYIKIYPPKILFIETNRLFVDDDWGRDSLTLLSLYESIKKGGLPNEYNEALEELLANSKFYLGMKQQIDINCNPTIHRSFFSDKFDTVAFRASKENRHLVRNFGQNQEFNEVIRHLNSKNIKVYFLELPNSPAYENTCLSPLERNRKKLLYAKYDSIFKVPTFVFNETLNDSDFFDGGHFNYKGAKKYNHWLVSLLDSIL
jgi:hypothetical protein